MLKISTSFYDPLALISPVTGTVSYGKLNCDEIIWREFLSNLEKWSCLKVKRLVFIEIVEFTVFATA